MRTNIYGKEQCIKGDKTTHNGVVLEGAPTRFWHGIPVARKGCKVYCPTCHPHIFEITEGFSNSTDNGIPLAGHGHMTGCGATLIASPASNELHSLGLKVLEGLAANQHSAWVYDEQVQAVDPETQQPIPDLPYYIESASGAVFMGYTDANGLCERITTPKAEELTVWLGEEAENKKRGM